MCLLNGTTACVWRIRVNVCTLMKACRKGAACGWRVLVLMGVF